MLVSGLAGVISRAGVVLRDPNVRSCRVYGLEQGIFYAHTRGSGTPRGLSFDTTYRGSRWEWWPEGGLADYHAGIDPNAPYGSEWAVRVPLWLPVAFGAIVLLPYFRRRIVVYRDAAKHPDICRACGYCTAGVPFNDGRRRCPECGALPGA